MEGEREQLLEKIRLLEEELARLKDAPRKTLFAGKVTKSEGKLADLTIAGVEEMVMLTDGRNNISFMNGPMARLLGVENRKAAIGAPLLTVDAIPEAEGVLASIGAMARDSEGTVAVEPSIERFPLERLPSQEGGRPSGPVILRILASRAGDKVQFVIQEVTKLRWLERTFSRYVPQKVIEKMQLVHERDFMRPERRNVTLLFGDLRGFTAMSEKIEPEKVAHVLNSFLSEMIYVFGLVEGTVDKFVGDEVIVVFGAPQEQQDHALRALVCAAEMQRRHEAWRVRQRRIGEPDPPLGIGISTGDVVLGNIGTAERSDYTAIGHTVNLAARLCAAAPGGAIYTVAETHRGAIEYLDQYAGALPVPHFRFKSAGQITLKNISVPVEILSMTVDV